MTKVIQIEKDLSVLDEAAEKLASGGLVAFPTETVYGLGANALSAPAVANIFVAKGRPQDNPLIVHISNTDMLSQIVKSVSPAAQKLMDTFWPGPLTIIFEKSDTIPMTVTAGLSTVAVRMPSHPVAQYLIEKSGVPVAAPSANLSGSPSTTRASHVIADLTGRVDYIIDGGACQVGLESTVLDMTGDVPQILRPGGVSLEELQAVLGEVAYEPALKDSRQVPKSPGMKYRHYAPKAELYLVEPQYTDELVKQLAVCRNQGKKTGVLCCGDTQYEADFKIDCGRDAQAYAQALFDALRQMDDLGAEVIFAEIPCDEGGIVPALMNRMLKASGGQVLAEGITTKIERL
ncbi:MAG: threonylcarbamoyl-AMP synthase [Clostridia bacterium]|nr:threonylcarbamoyl-AMP synthase [Clostridia bacterium]